MAAKRDPSLLVDVRSGDFEVLEDGKNVFVSLVSTLESSPSSPEPASLPAEDLSTNSNGPKPAEVMSDDDREDLFADGGNPVIVQHQMDPRWVSPVACCADSVHGGKLLLFGHLSYYIIFLQENNSILKGYSHENPLLHLDKGKATQVV